MACLNPQHFSCFYPQNGWVIFQDLWWWDDAASLNFKEEVSTILKLGYTKSIPSKFPSEAWMLMKNPDFVQNPIPIFVKMDFRLLCIDYFEQGDKPNFCRFFILGHVELHGTRAVFPKSVVRMICQATDWDALAVRRAIRITCSSGFIKKVSRREFEVHECFANRYKGSMPSYAFKGIKPGVLTNMQKRIYDAMTKTMKHTENRMVQDVMESYEDLKARYQLLEARYHQLEVKNARLEGKLEMNPIPPFKDGLQTGLSIQGKELPVFQGPSKPKLVKPDKSDTYDLSH